MYNCQNPACPACGYFQQKKSTANTSVQAARFSLKFFSQNWGCSLSASTSAKGYIYVQCSVLLEETKTILAKDSAAYTTRNYQ